jgi:hypothetical protein
MITYVPRLPESIMSLPGGPGDVLITELAKSTCVIATFARLPSGSGSRWPSSLLAGCNQCAATESFHRGRFILVSGSGALASIAWM